MDILLKGLLLSVLLSFPASQLLAASVSISRSVRSVTQEEIADGAPAGGFVHDFFLTSATDMLSFSTVMVNTPLFSHELGSHTQAPPPELEVMSESISAHSFITSTGDTGIAGADSSLESGLRSYFDTANLGASDQFHFARLTVSEAGSFAGRVSVRGYHEDQTDYGFVYLPFEFDLTISSDFLVADASLDYLLEPSARPQPVIETPPVADPAEPMLPPVAPEPACDETTADHRAPAVEEPTEQEPTPIVNQPDDTGIQRDPIILLADDHEPEPAITTSIETKAVFEVTNPTTIDRSRFAFNLGEITVQPGIATDVIHLLDYDGGLVLTESGSFTFLSTNSTGAGDLKSQIPEPTSFCLTTTSYWLVSFCWRRRRSHAA